jgi:phosphatidylglycerol:prolipoprotein diacylglycerol transferase
MAYPNAIVGWHYPPGVRVHPTPLYEMALYVLVFMFLWTIRTRPNPNGTVFWWYLVLAPAARFVVEFVRINPPVVFSLTEAQVISVILVAIGVWRLLAARGFAVQPTASLSASKQ